MGIVDATNVAKITYSGKTTNIKGNGTNIPDSEKHLEPTTSTDYPYDEGSYAETQISPNLDREFSPTLAAKYDKKDHVVYADGLRVTTVDIPLKYDDRYIRDNDNLLSNKVLNNFSSIIRYGELWGAGSNGNGALSRNIGAGNKSNFVRIGRSDKFGGNWVEKNGTTFTPASVVGTSSVNIIKSGGEILGFGLNTSGQIGVGDTTDKLEMTNISSGGSTWRKQYSANMYTLAINNKNELWGWGFNDGGNLGLGNNIHQSSPQLIETNTDFIKLFVSSGRTTVGIKQDHTVWVCGFHDNYRLGNGSNSGTTNVFTEISTPVRVKAYFFSGFTAHIWGEDGSLWSIGNNNNGTLGTNSNTLYVTPTWEQVNWLWDDIVSISASDTAINVVTASGKRIAWGLNSDGQFGNGGVGPSPQTSPTYIDSGWSHVYGGAQAHVIGVKKDKTLWGWGRNSSGQLGVGDLLQKNIPTQITFPPNIEDADVFCSANNTYLITKPNKIQQLISWGANSPGGNGTNNASTSHSPFYVGSDFKQVSPQDGHTLAIKNDGTLWATGRNGNGQLGLGDNVIRGVFTQVGVDTDWDYIFTGSSSSSWVRKTDGSIWCWGANLFGELGLGDLIDRNTPQNFAPSGVWDDVYQGRLHTILKKSDGTLWGMGNGYAINAGDSATHSSPMLVYGGTDWSNVSPGAGFTILIKDNGDVLATGLNGEGQLGAGNGVGTQTTFIKILSNVFVKDIESTLFTFMIKRDGTLWAWGTNFNGQIGIGPPADHQWLPIQVGTDNDWDTVTLGITHSITKKINGEFYYTGGDNQGQSGDTSITNSVNVPTLIDIPSSYFVQAGATQSFALTD